MEKEDIDLNALLIEQMDNLYRFALRRTGSDQTAEEVVQETCAAALSAFPKLRNKSRVLPWLWGIARNMVSRALAPSPEFSLPMEEFTAWETGDEEGAAGIRLVSYATPKQNFFEKQEILKVRLALSRMAKAYREVCILYYLEELDYNAIAKKLSIPLSTVKWRLNQSKVHLKKEMERMEQTNWMEHRYHHAIPLSLNIGGHGNYSGLPYGGAKTALSSLLSQNICLAAREPKTVTELSGELGVAADYIEDLLPALLRANALGKKGVKVQTMFPIWSGKTYAGILEANLACAREHGAASLLDALTDLSDSVSAIGFHGAGKNAADLLPMLIGVMGEAVSENRFPEEDLPFRDENMAWYILALTDRWPSLSCASGGVSCFDFGNVGNGYEASEFFFGPPDYKGPDSRLRADASVMASFLAGKPLSQAALAGLMERGLASTAGIAVPVLDEKKGELAQLLEALSPVIRRAEEIQHAIHTVSKENVTKALAPHLLPQAPFFANYLSFNVLESILRHEAVSRGTVLRADTVHWFILR